MSEVQVLDWLPVSFISFEELKEDYPQLTSNDWLNLSSDINIPISRFRVREAGKSIGRLVKGLNWDDVSKIEEFYRPFREDQIRIEEEIERRELAESSEREARELEESQARRLAERQAAIDAREELEMRVAAKAELDRIDAERRAQHEAALQTAKKNEAFAKLKEEQDRIDAVELAEKLAERSQLQVFWAERSEAISKAPMAQEGTKSANKLADELGVATSTLNAIAARNDIQSSLYRFPIGPGGSGYDKEQSERLREIIAERKKKVVIDKSRSLPAIKRKHKISKEYLNEILGELKINPDMYLFGRFWMLGITARDLKTLNAYLKVHLVKAAPRYVKSLSSLGLDTEIGVELAIGAGIEPKEYRFDGKVRKGLTKPEIKIIKEAYEDEQLKLLLPRPVLECAEQRGMTSDAMLRKARKLGMQIDKHRFGNQMKFGFLPHHLEEFDRLVESQAILPAPSNVHSVKRAARSRKMKESTLLEFAEEASIKPKPYLVQGVETDCFSDAQLLDIEKAYDPEVMKLFAPISIRPYAKSQRTQPAVILDLAREAKIELKEYYFGSKKNWGLTPQNIFDLEKAYEGLPRAEFSDETTFPLGTIAKNNGLTLKEIRGLLVDAHIESPEYRFPNGKDLPGLKEAQVLELKDVYRGFGLGD